MNSRFVSTRLCQAAIAWCFVLCLSANSAAQPTPAYTRFLPKKTVALIQVNDFGDLVKLIGNSGLGEYNRRCLQPVFAKEFNARFDNALEGAEVQGTLATLEGCRPESGLLAVYDSRGELALFLELGPVTGDEFESVLALIMALPASKSKLTEFDGDHDRVKYYSFQLYSTTVYIAHVNDRIVCSSQKTELQRAIRFTGGDAGAADVDSLSNSRKYATCQKQAHSGDNTVASFFLDLSVLLDEKRVRTSLRSEDYQRLVELGLLDIVFVGGAISSSEPGSNWKLNLFVPIALPRRGLFGSIAWQPLEKGFETAVPPDSRFLVAYRFDVSDSFESARHLLSLLGDNLFVARVCQVYLGVTSIIERHAKYLNGSQLAFLVDTGEDLFFSETIARAYYLNRRPPEKEMPVAESVGNILRDANYERIPASRWTIWAQDFDTWQQDKQRYTELAKIQTHLPPKIVYPRLTVAIDQKFLYKFTNPEAARKCEDAQLNNESIDQQEWYRSATATVASQDVGQPHFLLVARRGEWIQALLNIVDSQDGFISSRVQPYLTATRGLPRLDPVIATAMPVFAIASWDRPDGLRIVISEAADPDSQADKE